jgi:AraC-like DNA-binding protein
MGKTSETTSTTTLWVGMPIVRNTTLAAGGNAKGIAEICADIGIAVDDLESADMRLTLDQCCAGILSAMRVSGDPHLGLHLGERTNVSALGLAGLMMASSKNALEVLRCAEEFSQAFTNLQTFRMEMVGDEVHLYTEVVQVWMDRSPRTAIHVIETSYSSVVHQLELLTRKHIRPVRLSFRHARPADTTEHERIFRCRPEFGQDVNGLVFAAADLRAPIIGHNKPLNDMLKVMYEDQMRKNANGAAFTEKVKQVMLGNLQVTFPPLEVIAEVLRMTPRTLQRKLSQEGTTFRALTDAVKQELAENLLANPDLTIADIAYKLGYFEPTSFQRAFRQWTGATPMEFRKNKA